MVKDISRNKIKWKSPYALYCALCKKSVSCAHQRLSHLTVHCSGKIHKSFHRARKTTQNVSEQPKGALSSLRQFLAIESPL